MRPVRLLARLPADGQRTYFTNNAVAPIKPAAVRTGSRNARKSIRGGSDKALSSSARIFSSTVFTSFSRTSAISPFPSAATLLASASQFKLRNHAVRNCQTPYGGPARRSWPAGPRRVSVTAFRHSLRGAQTRRTSCISRGRSRRVTLPSPCRGGGSAPRAPRQWRRSARRRCGLWARRWCSAKTVAGQPTSSKRWFILYGKCAGSISGLSSV